MRSTPVFEQYGKAYPLTDARLTRHVWQSSDAMYRLADRYFGDWKLWRVIAEKNNVADVRNITPGTLLVIPERPLERGRYEST